jgi:hypothetical protein
MGRNKHYRYMLRRQVPSAAQAHAPITFGPMIAGSLRRGVFRSLGAMLIKSGCCFCKTADVLPMHRCESLLKCSAQLCVSSQAAASEAKYSVFTFSRTCGLG